MYEATVLMWLEQTLLHISFLGPLKQLIDDLETLGVRPHIRLDRHFPANSIRKHSLYALTQSILRLNDSRIFFSGTCLTLGEHTCLII